MHDASFKIASLQEPNFKFESFYYRFNQFRTPDWRELIVSVTENDLIDNLIAIQVLKFQTYIVISAQPNFKWFINPKTYLNIVSFIEADLRL